MASRLFLLMAGIVIALWLYVINLDSWELPTLVTLAGHDITEYALIVLLIFIGVLAGAFIKYGMRGGRLKLS